MAKSGDSKSQVLIAGGGIGGLSTGLALARQGLAATVLERSTFTEESGAGIQLGPNATRLLAQLGVLEAIECVAFKPSAIWLFDGLSGKRLAAIPLGAHSENRYRAPYLTLHRADLQAALHTACSEAKKVTLKPRFEVGGITQTGASVRATSTDGGVAEGPALIAADGVWSEVRKTVAPNARLIFAGATAWRTLVPRVGLGHPFAAPVVGVWLAPNAHLVHYPVRAGSDLNVVAIIEGGADARGWNETGDAAALRSAFTHWCKDSKSLLEADASWRCWSLYRLAGLNGWSGGRIALLGDAAHPVLPYLAQGAALAIEDAVVIAETLAECGGDALTAFPLYAARREARAKTVAQKSERYGKRYHLSGAMRVARNLVLHSQSGGQLLGGLDWLYGEPGSKRFGKN
jgi:2-polyprenyl-6-methoxyphenol hydroxylase-like FAD-dependent oxidoreductase